jgi:N-acetyl-alpha-D-glucosaminyl L-malate synthase BshA
MKIGISCYPTYGGSGIVATELGKNLAQRGHEIHFIAYALPYRLNEYYDNIFFHEVKVPEYPLFEYPPYALALATKLADIAIHEKLDLIHVHYAIPHAISAYLAREMIRDQHRLKIITTLHGTDITLVGADPSFLRITQYGINRSDAVTAVSEFLKSETIKTFNPTKPIKVIHNFIKEHPQQNTVCNQLRKRYAPNGESILIHLSNFRPVKRVLDTILIAKRVLEEISIRLVLIGDGPDRPIAEKMSRELGIENDVVFLGKQEEVYFLLSLGDIFLMPSQSESFGLAALEAMACGLPCITSNAGGLTELNIHGESGFVAPVGDVEQMSGYVLKILKEPGFKEMLSHQARERAFKSFHSDIIIPQYINLYEEVLSS